MRLLYRLLEDKKHKEIVHFLLFFSKFNSKFVWLTLKEQLFYLFYISFSFTLLVCGAIFFDKLNHQLSAGAARSRMFLAPWSRSHFKKNTRSRSRLKKEIRSRSRSRLEKKPLQNYPTPQPSGRKKKVLTLDSQ